jgi:hypothetical protein
MTDPFWLATLLLVWCPVLALVILAAAQAPVLVGTGPAFGNGMRIFGVLLLGVLVGLTRVPPPRLARLAAVPALIIAIVVWLAT